MQSDVLFLLHLEKLAKSEATAIVVKDKTGQWPIMKIGLVYPTSKFAVFRNPKF